MGNTQGLHLQKEGRRCQNKGQGYVENELIAQKEKFQLSNENKKFIHCCRRLERARGGMLGQLHKRQPENKKQNQGFRVGILGRGGGKGGIGGHHITKGSYFKK